MRARERGRYSNLYLLSDHLDAALAMGEDLLGEKVALLGPDRPLTEQRLARQNSDLANFVLTARTLELTMAARLLQARKRAAELKRGDSHLKPLIGLFVAGTAPLADAAAELGDTTEQDFDTGNATLPFLRSRGLIARDAPGLDGLTGLAVSEDYMVAARIRLGTLLDLVATFLDSLDLMFDLYSNSEARRAGDVSPSDRKSVAPAEPRRC